MNKFKSMFMIKFRLQIWCYCNNNNNNHRKGFFYVHDYCWCLAIAIPHRFEVNRSNSISTMAINGTMATSNVKVNCSSSSSMMNRLVEYIFGIQLANVTLVYLGKLSRDNNCSFSLFFHSQFPISTTSHPLAIGTREVCTTEKAQFHRSWIWEQGDWVTSRFDCTTGKVKLPFGDQQTERSRK